MLGVGRIKQPGASQARGMAWISMLHRAKAQRDTQARPWAAEPGMGAAKACIVALACTAARLCCDMQLDGPTDVFWLLKRFPLGLVKRASRAG